MLKKIIEKLKKNNNYEIITSDYIDCLILDLEKAQEVREEMIKIIKSYINSGCYHCSDSDIISNVNEEQCKGCVYYSGILFLEKLLNKSWEELSNERNN